MGSAEREFSLPVKKPEDALDRSSQSLRVFEVSLYAKKLNETNLAKQTVNISNLLSKTN